MARFIFDPYVLFVELSLSVLIYDFLRSLARDGWGRTPGIWRGEEGAED